MGGGGLVSWESVQDETVRLLRVRKPPPYIVSMVAPEGEGGQKRTIVSVTYGVGTHARDGCELGCDPDWPVKCLSPSLEALRRAAALDGGRRGSLERLSVFMLGYCEVVR